MGSQTVSAAVVQVPPVVRDFCARRYADSGASGFGLDHAALEQVVAGVLERSGATPVQEQAHDFLEALRLEELVLARACANGNEKAWEQFLARYRTVLYGTAYKIVHDDAAARELADSIYAELYGIGEGGRERTSKLLYYSGRGSLEGWLRTVVAQEFVNRHRKTLKETSLDETVEAGAQFSAAPAAASVIPDSRLEHATESAIQAAPPEDRFLLASYYLDGRTLADIARLLRVHESTISRRLERATSELRKRIRKTLMSAGMSSRQAQEVMQDSDVRDLQVSVRESLRQEKRDTAFYKGEE